MASRPASHSGFVFGRAFLVAVVAASLGAAALADDAAPAKAESKPTEATKPASSGGSDAQKSSSSSTAALLKDASKVPGLVPLYMKDDKLYAELSDGMLGKEFFVLTSIARGIGERSLLGGMSYGSGDDWIWEFRKVNDAIQVVRKNVRFFAAKGSPEAKAVDLAYTDSVLFSVPIKGRGPGGGHLIDLAPIFLTDLPRIAAELPGFSFARDRSTWGRIKNFPDNVELGGRHLRLQRREDDRHRSRFAGRDPQHSLLAEPAAAELVHAPAGR